MKCKVDGCNNEVNNRFGKYGYCTECLDIMWEREEVDNDGDSPSEEGEENGR